MTAANGKPVQPKHYFRGDLQPYVKPLMTVLGLLIAAMVIFVLIIEPIAALGLLLSIGLYGVISYYMPWKTSIGIDGTKVNLNTVSGAAVTTAFVVHINDVERLELKGKKLLLWFTRAGKRKKFYFYSADETDYEQLSRLLNCSL